MARNTYVRIGEAARLAGVSVDTLRRWERQGKLSGIRTFGGQRTYSLEEIESLRDDSEPDDEQDAPERPETPPRQPVTTPPVPPWKAREANAAADLAITRSKIEQREEIRRHREEEQRRAAAAQATAEARAAEARLNASREAEGKRQQQALESALWRIRLQLIGEPSDARAEVERFLSEHATPDESVQWLNAEVEAILDRRRAERNAAAQRKSEEERQQMEQASRKASDDWRRSLLLSHGEAFAQQLTIDRDEWDEDDADEALEEVREQLADAVEPTWTEKRVERAVRDMLADWD